MKKEIEINGMNCGHCQMRVEKALGAIPGVEAKVDLKNRTATVTMANDVPDDVLMEAVRTAGYEPVAVREKKSLFGK